MKNNYDVIVIGSGVAGKSTASGLASTGKSVAIIEDDLWGGTCPNRGCDPKKVLVSVVEAQNKANQLIGKGLTHAPSVDWADLMAFKKTFTDPISEQSKKSLMSSGVETYTGTARFLNEHTIQVKAEILTADRFVIATGARPHILDIIGHDHFLTSDDFLSLPDMPDTVTFIGGGYIAFEFAAIAQAAGAKVHVIQHNHTPLKAYDQDFVKDIMAHLEKKGVTFHLGTRITKIEKVSDGFNLTDDDDFQLMTDLVFATTGRAPNTHALNLDNANVDYNKKGIVVNDYLQTTNPAIFALGDVLSKSHPKLTPVSSLESNYLVSFLTNKTDQPLTYPLIPTLVFSSPKLAQIGVTVKKAAENESVYNIIDIDATQWFSYSRLNEPLSKAKLIFEKESGHIVGATCLSNEADQLINYFSLIISNKIKASDLADTVFAYPTIASDLPYFYS